MKIGHVKIDRAHFRAYFREHWKITREHWKISREHSRGSLRGDPLVRFTQKTTSTFVGISMDIFVYTHFREHIRERVRGSNFAVRVLCACLRKPNRVLRSPGFRCPGCPKFPSELWSSGVAALKGQT